FFAAAVDVMKGRGAAAAVHAIQALSVLAGGVAFSVYAASLFVQSFGVSTSWLGWGIVLVVIGLALGFVAS
ncbi:hypothetical protein, partial [Klebsiella variicola]|uniref:hypothetical protein n=1 Tax=Klebsiella variicola TaxID=244366 RepID=UPI001953F625